MKYRGSHIEHEREPNVRIISKNTNTIRGATCNLLPQHFLALASMTPFWFTCVCVSVKTAENSVAPHIFIHSAHAVAPARFQIVIRVRALLLHSGMITSFTSY